MSITLDALLGSNLEDASTNSIQLTTAAAVAAGATIVLGICQYDSTSDFITSVSGGGLSWAIDHQGLNALRCTGFASAHAPSGLAASTVLTVNYLNSRNARIVGGASFLGIPSTSPVDGTPTGPTAVGSGTWTTDSYACESGSLLVGLDFCLNVTSGGHTPNGDSSEAWEAVRLADNYGAAMVYRVVPSAASYTVGGSWTASSSSNVGVAYLADEVTAQNQLAWIKAMTADQRSRLREAQEQFKYGRERRWQWQRRRSGLLVPGAPA